MNVNVTTFGMAIGILIARRVHIQIDKLAGELRETVGRWVLLEIPSIARMLGLGDGYYHFTLGDLVFALFIFALIVLAKFIPVVMPVAVAFVIYDTFFELNELILGTYLKDSDPIAPSGGT